jgi:hypothetical protein
MEARHLRLGKPALPVRTAPLLPALQLNFHVLLEAIVRCDQSLHYPVLLGKKLSPFSEPHFYIYSLNLKFFVISDSFVVLLD